MDHARSLRDVFADLVGDESARSAHAADPEGFLRAQGHGELPEGLVAEAIVNYADTAPAEVAEHLAPFVMAHSPVPVEDDGVEDLDASHGLDLLATAPPGLDLDEFPPEPDLGDDFGTEAVAGELDAAGTLDDSVDLDFGLDFGRGDAGFDPGADDASEAGAEADGPAGLDDESDQPVPVQVGDEAAAGGPAAEDDLGSVDWLADDDVDLLDGDDTEDGGPDSE